MFTGIIQEVGTVIQTSKVGGGLHITVRAPRASGELRVNDSVSINGVCQTVIKRQGDHFTVEAVEETLKKTTLGDLQVSTQVNLELALRLNDRVGGHLVQGHVDGIGVVRSVVRKESSWLISVEIPAEFTRYVIPVGSIAIDGVSLTVASIQDSLVIVSIIPHTMENTNFGNFEAGTRVNLEFDLVGKYIERLAGVSTDSTRSLSREKLREWGYDV